MTFFRNLFVLLALPVVLAAAATPTAAPLRLYHSLSPSAAALTPTAAPWSLRILPNSAKAPVPGSRFIRVLILREAMSKASDGFLLTVSGTSVNTKKRPVSRQQDRPSFAEGQTLYEADFRVDSPDCGPVRVVAALFKDLEPLARSETTLGFDCGE